MSAHTMASIKTPIINARDVITVTARLAQVLAEEVDHLQGMDIKKIEKLQEEKLFLIDALEAYKKVARRQPDLSEMIPSQDKADLEGIFDVFTDILQENKRRLQVAKEVNQQVVKAIRDVAAQNAETPYYMNSGTRMISPYESMSVTLNQTI